MHIQGYGNRNNYSTQRVASNRTIGNFSLNSHKDSGNFSLKMGGEASHALAGGANVTVYKSDNYSEKNPLMRVIKTESDGRESQQIIDPRRVNPSSATDDEIFALNAFLVEQGKLDNSVYQTSILSPNHSTAPKNFLSIVNEQMLMQKDANNFGGYAKYRQILDVYESL